MAKYAIKKEKQVTPPKCVFIPERRIVRKMIKALIKFGKIEDPVKFFMRFGLAEDPQKVLKDKNF
jgi:hypothetical protein